MQLTRFSALLLLFSLTASYSAPTLIDKPILFNKTRIELTRQYRKDHYGVIAQGIKISPIMIILHYTVIPTFQESFAYLYPPTITDRPYLSEFSPLNVSAHFLVDRDGKIYKLMPTDWMARHVIGLNDLAIGIENVGGAGLNKNLTAAQVASNVALIRYLRKQYPAIRYLIGHYEYGIFRNTPLWKEKDKHYFTEKFDPGAAFMRAVRSRVTDLKLLPTQTLPDPKGTSR